MLHDNLLSLLVFLPVLGALLLLVLPATPEFNRGLKWTAFGVTALTFVFSICLIPGFVAGAGMQFEIIKPWIPPLGANYHLGVDGISLWLVILNTFLFPLAILASINVIKKREKLYYILMLLLEAAVTGVFLAQDLLLFYFFWEAVLIPMYFLIGIWGGKKRMYATIKFVVFTMVGSLLMLVAVIAVWLASVEHFGAPTFNLSEIKQIPFAAEFQVWCFLAFALAFAIKVPLFPFHTWLPDAHTEAPTAGSIILAGVLLKMGTYGFIRLAIPLFPDASFYPLAGGSLTIKGLISALAVIGIIYGALVAAVQVDVKRLVAYSSIAHLGFVMLGIFSFTQQGMDGAIIQMISHGISTGALFMLVGFIYDRRHTRMIADFGGLAKPMPVYFNLFLIMMLSSVGLPALNGFVGEFLILIGSFQDNAVLTGIATFGVVLAAIYLLYMFRRVFFGEVTHEENRGLKDLTPREVWAVLPLAVMAFVIGIFPNLFLKPMTADSKQVIKMMDVSAETTIDAKTDATEEKPAKDIRQFVIARFGGFE